MHGVREKSNRLQSKNYLSTFNLQTNLNPWFVTGFTDAEASFTISIYKKNNLKLGWQVNASFQIELNFIDEELLIQIKQFFCDVGGFCVNA